MLGISGKTPLEVLSFLVGVDRLVTAALSGCC